MAEPTSAAFRGALDLSSLVKPANTAATPAAPTAPMANPVADESGELRVPSLVMDVTQDKLASYVRLSERVPVIVEFTTVRMESSATLSEKLVADVSRRNGDIILLRMDGDKSNEMVTAFQLQSLPAVAGLLRGSPVPMFVGDQPADVISQVIDKIISLAHENGITGKAIADESAEIAKPKLPPRHQAAYDAIEAENYDQAIAEFEAALNEAPADAIAATGLAQAKLLKRTDKLDLQQILESPAQALDDVLLKADALALIGHFDMSFKAILDVFEVATKEDREILRAHLLELFKVAGNNNPAIGPARIRLTNLLF
ncbi:MAG: hypothetical protein RL508_996 [Actinomycetota bacterium]|jgi:putative thioredoxin